MNDKTISLEKYFKTQVIPSELDNENETRFKTLVGHQFLVKFPFAISVIGSCGSGKSSTIWSMVKKFYKNAFDLIIIYNGTKDSNEAWQSLESKKTEVILKNKFNMVDFKKVIETIGNSNDELRKKKKKRINVLFVFDDMASKDILHPQRRDSVLEALLNRRHINVSFIFASQRYKLLPQDWRTTNINALLICSISPLELDMVANEQQTTDTPPEMIKEFYKMTKAEDQFRPFIIDLTKPPDKRFRSGWLEFFKAK